MARFLPCCVARKRIFGLVSSTPTELMFVCAYLRNSILLCCLEAGETGSSITPLSLHNGASVSGPVAASLEGVTAEGVCFRVRRVSNCQGFCYRICWEGLLIPFDLNTDERHQAVAICTAVTISGLEGRCI